MIILKYNQTFGVLISFLFLTPTCYLSFLFCFVLFSFYLFPRLLQTNMHSNTHANWSEFLRKCVTYNQIRFELIHPSPLKSFLHVKIYFIACLCNRPKSLSLGVPLLIDPTRIKAKSLKGTRGVFCRSVMVWYSHFGNLYLNSWTAEWYFTPTLFQKANRTLKSKSFSKKPIIHLLVTNAMSVCNLVSTLLLSEFTKGVVSDLTMSYFSLRGGGGGGGKGLGGEY